MVVTDLDGTLLDGQRRLSAADRATLEDLGRRGITRVVATGRSLFSARRVLGPDVPIDFLAHTSGAGIVSWPGQESLLARHMPGALSVLLAERLLALELDFMLHRAIPDNHHFFMHKSSRQNHDFDRRVELYAPYAAELRLSLLGREAMCQAVVIEPLTTLGRHAELALALPEFRLIRATSPLDHVSAWFEVFPEGVAKSSAAAWVRERMGNVVGSCVAVGNDYNDVDLLDWADLPFVVANAPEELRVRYPNVPSNEASGFSAAVRQALD